jgi:hypothetical protein
MKSVQPNKSPRERRLALLEEKRASSCMSGLHCSLSFHSWLRNQDQWVIAVAQSDSVYQAMKLAYAANTQGQP